MSQILVIGRVRCVRRVLLLVGVAFAGLPCGSALADTTIGQTGTPLLIAPFGGGEETVSPAAAVPTGGTITSFQTQSSTCQVAGVGFVQGIYNFQVLRPEGNNQYVVLGDTGNQTDPCDSQLHSYPVNIPAQTGDVLGVYVLSNWAGLLRLSGPVGYYDDSVQAEPTVGATVTVPKMTTTQVDEAATLVSLPTSNDPLPTSKDQCKDGGWKSFGVFKNQGDCVSFVATGGKNPAQRLLARDERGLRERHRARRGSLHFAYR